MTMRAVLALISALLGSPVAAATWACALDERCATGSGCVKPVGARAEITVAADGASADVRVGDVNQGFSRVAQAPDSATYLAVLGDGTIAFFTLFEDGTIALSSHEVARDDIASVASDGACTRTAP
jgi:hypothetical protein